MIADTNAGQTIDGIASIVPTTNNDDSFIYRLADLLNATDKAPNDSTKRPPLPAGKLIGRGSSKYVAVGLSKEGLAKSNHGDERISVEHSPSPHPVKKGEGPPNLTTGRPCFRGAAGTRRGEKRKVAHDSRGTFGIALVGT